MNIAILTPTRGRPDRVLKFHNSVRNLADDNSSIYMYYYLDDDDSTLENYKLNIKLSEHTYLKVGPAISISKSWNTIAKMAIKDGADILIMGNDDLVYETEGWDSILKEEIKNFPDNIYCMWFQDKINGNKHCAFPIISKQWYNCLEYFTPGIFHFGYNDTWIFDIAKRINRTHYIDKVITDHQHFTKYPKLNDKTYIRNRTSYRGNLFEKDKKIFEATEGEREKHAHKLRVYINENSNL